MKFKPNFVSAFLLTCLCAAVCTAAAEEPVGAAAKSESAPQNRKLESRNQNVDLSKFEALRLRHLIALLPYAKKSAHPEVKSSENRRLDGKRPANARATMDEQEEENGQQHITWSDVQEQTQPEFIESQAIADSQMTDSVISNPDAFSASSHDQQFYEAGSELFLAQEQKRILLLQFYEVIVNNPNRSPQVDPRIIKLMTNYLQTLEYIYVKQIQHKEESPPVLYDYRTDNETAAFCDSPPVSLPDQKFLNEDGDYFVKLFDAYNAGQLGVYMSPTQLKQQGLYRKLAGHIAQANADHRFRQSQFNARAREIARTMVRSRAKHALFERRLKQKSKPEKKAKTDALSKAELSLETSNFKVDPNYVPHVIEAQSYDPDAFIPILPGTKKHKKRNSKKAAEAQKGKSEATAVVEPPKKKSKRTRRLSARRSIRVPVEYNSGNDDPAPIFDDHPIQNANVYRENIHEDLMEILQFFSQQLNLIFRRLEILADANQGLARWIIKPHWRDFEASIQYFQALAAPTNRIIDAIDLIIRGCGNHAGNGFMSHLFLQENRFTVLHRRAAAIENALSTARIHLIQMQNNMASLRHQAIQARDNASRNAINIQVNQQIQATRQQQQSVNDLVRRMNVVTRYRNEGRRMGISFNQMGNEIANQARVIRRNYVELELLGRTLITTTQTDLTNPRHQAISLRIFEQSLPRMIQLKRLVVSGIRRLVPAMDEILRYRPTITNYLSRYENTMTRRRKARKMKQKSKDGKDGNKDVI